MIEHWYEYLPEAWFIPEGRWYVALSVFLISLLGFFLGFLLKVFLTNRWLRKNDIDHRNLKQ